jgi:hypothetical protein
LHGHYLSVRRFKEQLLAIAAPARLLAAGKDVSSSSNASRWLMAAATSGSSGEQ